MHMITSAPLIVIGMLAVLLTRNGHRRPARFLLIALLVIWCVPGFSTMLERLPSQVERTARSMSYKFTRVAASAKPDVTPHTSHQADSPEVLAEEQPTPEASLPPRQQLFSNVVDTWRASIYPSDRSAIQALLALVNKDWMAQSNYDEPSEICVQGAVRNEILVWAVDFLKKMHPWARISLVQGQDEEDVLSKRRHVAVFRLQAMPSPSQQSIASSRVTLLQGSSNSWQQAEFMQKPWLDDFAAFISENPKRTYVVAMSQKPETSNQEAERDALAVATQSLKQRVLDRMTAKARESLARMSDGDGWLKEQIAAELRNGQMVVDKFVQQLRTSYEEAVWQTSLLIDASPKNISALAQKLDQLLAQQERGTRQEILSVLGVIALVCLVYAGLNAATRGYFVWSLRAVAMAMIAGGIFLVLLFRR